MVSALCTFVPYKGMAYVAMGSTIRRELLLSRRDIPRTKQCKGAFVLVWSVETNSVSLIVARFKTFFVNEM